MYDPSRSNKYFYSNLFAVKKLMNCLAFLQNQTENNGDISILIGVLVVFAVLVIGGSLIFKMRKYFQETAQINDLLKNGEPAEAVVLKLAGTGSSINHDPQVILQLEVYPPERDSYQAEVKFYVSRLRISQVQPGNRIAVKINRQDQSKIAVDLA